MAITAGNWASVTDPFILALSHSWTGTSVSASSIILTASAGFLNAISKDKDIQEVYFSQDVNGEKTFAATALETEILSVLDYRNEWPVDQSETIPGWVTHDLIQDDTKDCRIAWSGKTTGGSIVYSLFAYSAYAWVGKDPAQIIFSWINYHVPSFLDLKDYLDYTQFSSASDYYDTNPIHLVLHREVGSSIAEQIKKLIDHTSDFLVIRPNATSGSVAMEILPRRSDLIDRTTEIDLDSDSVAGYTIRPTDRFTLDEIESVYGNTFQDQFLPSDQSDYKFTPEYKTSTIKSVRQRVGDVDDLRSITLDVPYLSYRRDVLAHIDIGFWKDDQDEVEIQFADWSHLNFEAGDIVHLTGRGYDGTNSFVVTEKTIDLDTMLATARFLQIYGISGLLPRMASITPPSFSFSPNSLGDYDDGTITFPIDAALQSNSRTLDRWWDESPNYCPCVEHLRGTPPSPMKLDLDVRERWPGFSSGNPLAAASRGFEMRDEYKNGFNKPSSTAGKSFTLYWVGNISSTYTSQAAYIFEMSGTSSMIFAVSGDGAGTGSYNTYQFYNGTWYGSTALQTGWQILVFRVDGSGFTIRRNGVVIDSGAGVLSGQLLSTANYGIAVNAAGTGASVGWDFMECHLFRTSHTDVSIEGVEAHLAEKYGITI